MTHNSYDFAGKVVLVTGAGSGIGRAIARAFLDNGASVAVAGRRPGPLSETVEGYDAGRTLTVSADVSQPDGARGLVQQVVEHFGHLDVLVNNAAAYAGGDLVDMSPDDWNAMRATNIDGFVWLVQGALPELAKTGGNVVVVGSVSGMRGDWNQAAYNASKAAIMNFVQSIALDWGARGVRLNSVAPAFTVTDLTREIAEDEKAVKPFLNRVALGRPGQPEDIAPAVLWLASADAAYVTGTTLTVDGGTTASTGQPHVE